jgi:hypothetical protein
MRVLLKETPPMELEQRYSAADISRIIDQALVYQCACPAQVATTLLELRDLYDYQVKCRDDDDANRRVHEAIAAATEEAHARMERCLDHVLEIEGWERATLTMPEALRKRATKSL